MQRERPGSESKVESVADMIMPPPRKTSSVTQTIQSDNPTANSIPKDKIQNHRKLGQLSDVEAKEGTIIDIKFSQLLELDAVNNAVNSLTGGHKRIN